MLFKKMETIWFVFGMNERMCSVRFAFWGTDFLVSYTLSFLTHEHCSGFSWNPVSLSLSLSLSSLSPQAALFVLLSTASVSLKHSSHTTKTGWVVPTARLREQTNTYTIKVCVKKGTRQHGRLILRERGTESESEGGREKIKGGKTRTQTHKGWKNNSGTTNAVCGTFCCKHTPTQKKKGQGDKFISTLLAGNVGNLDCKRAATVCTSTEKEHLL